MDERDNPSYLERKMILVEDRMWRTMRSRSKLDIRDQITREQATL